MHNRALAFVVVGLVVAAWGVRAVAEEGKGRFADVGHKELKTAIAEKKVVLLDCNGSQSFAKNHIPGALDFQAVKDKLAEVLPKEKDTLIVAYCGSEKCKAYLGGAEAAAALGYTNVKHFAPGIKGWLRAEQETLKEAACEHPGGEPATGK